jgi:pyruvate formate lyase activating enzyme
LVAFKGLEKFSSKDFPGHISATFFTGGCNFRCPFCHNADLVLRPDRLVTVPEAEVREFLERRENWLEGVCVTGGEPLIHPDLHENLSFFKRRGLLVKLDTNGSFPDSLKSLLDDGLVDVVAMDIKAPLDKYPEAAGVEVDEDSILRSIGLIRGLGAGSYFRTTVVPGLIDDGEIRKIGRMLEGTDKIVLQAFSPVNTLDPGYARRKPYPAHRMRELAELLRPEVGQVVVEGEG